MTTLLRPPRLVTIIMAVAVTQTALRLGIVPFFPEIQAVYGVSNAQVGTLFSVYFITFALLQLPAGHVADRHAPGPILLISLFTLVCATTLFVLSKDWNLTLIARMAMGAASAAVFPTVIRLIHRTAKPNQHSGLFGIYEAGIALAMLLTLSFVPLFSPWIGLNSLHLGLIVYTLIVMLILIRSPHIHHANQLAQQERGTSQQKHNVRPESPYAHVSVSRRIVVLVGLVLFASIPISSVMTWSPTYLRLGLGYSVTEAGLVLGVITGSYLLFAFLSGRWANTHQRFPIIIAGSWLMLTGLAFLLLLPSSTHLFFILLVGAILGMGGAIAFTPSIIIITDLFGPQRAGLSAALLAITSHISNIMIGALFGWLIDITGSYQLLWVIGVVCLLLRVMVTRLIKEVPLPGMRTLATVLQELRVTYALLRNRIVLWVLTDV